MTPCVCCGGELLPGVPILPTDGSGMAHVTCPEPDREPRGFRGPDAVALAGISYRQLDYWCRTGLVEPSVRPAKGSGTQRLYSRDDVVRLALCKRLLDAGMSLSVIRSSLDALLTSYAYGGDPAVLHLAEDVVLTVPLAPLYDAIPELPDPVPRPLLRSL